MYSYDENDKGNYTLFFDSEKIGELIVGEDTAIEIVIACNSS